MRPPRFDRRFGRLTVLPLALSRRYRVSPLSARCIGGEPGQPAPAPAPAPA
jgi:hypothetical protein